MNKPIHCPYYGYHAFPHLKVLIAQGGNQCPFILTAYSPCEMEMRGLRVDWDKCELNDKSPVRIEIQSFEKLPR